MNTSDELAKRIKLFELAFEKYNKVSEQLGGRKSPVSGNHTVGAWTAYRK